jgi:hypothetical protein
MSLSNEPGINTIERTTLGVPRGKGNNNDLFLPQ